MVTTESFRQLALSFSSTSEQAHFELTSFRVSKKIFATLDEKRKRACLMLSEIDQSVFCTIDKSIIYPVPNKWGQKGATYVELDKVKRSILKDMIEHAYDKIITKRK